MVKIFKVTGIIISIAAFISFFLLIAGLFDFSGWEVLLGLFSISISFVLGLAIYSIGELLRRVSYLERKLKFSVKDEPDPPRSELRKKRREGKAKQKKFDIPQQQCPECGDRHDFDYIKCPKCGHIYEGGQEK